MSLPNPADCLGKSLYMRGLQCRKSLYLDRRRPDLRGGAAPDVQARRAAGQEVCAHARMLFPGGAVVPSDRLTADEQLGRTREAIARGTKAVYEAAFFHDGIFARADIVVRSRGYWDLYEVKSSTSVREHHRDDAAIQYYVLAGCGVAVNRAYLVHLNSGYVRHGDVVPEDLFVIRDITGPAEIARLRRGLLEYCRQDTLGLVRLMEALRSMQSR